MQASPRGNMPSSGRRAPRASRSDDRTNMLLAMKQQVEIEGGPPAEEDTKAPPRRFNRRASTGGFPASLNAEMNPSKRSTVSSDSNNEARHGTLTKQESQVKLRQSLAVVNDYKDRDDKIQMLQERFSSSKTGLKPAPRSAARQSRRTSLSSYHSSANDSGVDPPRSKSGDLSGSDISIDLSQSKRSDLSFTMSAANTIPIANVVDASQHTKNQAKTDQIVESLVWFSFHTPRTVMEDLITHEIQLWRRHVRRNSLKKKHAKSAASAKDYKMTYMSNRDDSADLSDDSSLSSLSDDGTGDVFDGNFSDSMMRLQGKASQKMIKLPKSVRRESALLFVDMSGFTKLSTLLDVESLSRVINSYFDMIVSEVIAFGGDILKFAGDAFFAEWRVVDEGEGECKGKGKGGNGDSPLSDLNASLASINEFSCDDDIPKLATCTLSAAKCAASIVRKFSDYQVTSVSNNVSEAMLNLHCGIGAGNLVGLHIGDYKEDQEEEGMELRREFLILGSPIDQVAKAADVATDGEVYASPEAMLSLAFCCEMSDAHQNAYEPVCIASREKLFLKLTPEAEVLKADGALLPTAALQPYESLRMHCKSLNHMALARLHLQMALYVHPVIRSDELALSAAIQKGKVSQPPEALESRHRAEAELRSVFTIFIKAVISPRVTGLSEVDSELFTNLNNIMHVTSRELDRYSGHLRQFIVDDKGVVLIATFGLRGSTFPNMISNNGLPAIFAIHRALKSELKVENRIGATFGKVYCGVVGGVRRHEFAVMGAPVNLAARLMSSKVNKGILVDEAVKEQADARFSFNSLPPVHAKGYDKPVPILEPYEVASSSKKKKSSVPFIGRQIEKETISNIASAILKNPERTQSTMVFLMGESGMGKSALAKSVVDDIRMKVDSEHDPQTIVAARSTSTETEQRIPLSSYRKVFTSVVREFCEQDGTLSHCDGQTVTSSGSTTNHSMLSVPATPRGVSRFRVQSGNTTTEEKSDHRPKLTRSPESSTLQGPTTSPSSRELSSVASSRQLLKHSEHGKKYLPSRSVNGDEKDALAKSLHTHVHATPTTTTKKFLPSSASLSQTVHGQGGLSKSVHLISTPIAVGSKECLGQSLHRVNAGQAHTPTRTPMRAPSITGRRVKNAGRDDMSTTSFDNSVHTNKNASVPYFEKLCWVCEELDYPFEYADIVGSQFLGLDGASPVTHVDGHVPTMDELVEFLALAFICLTDFADLIVVLLDDFQWVDSFSWKIFQVLCKRGERLLVMCATRSHDKQALRRLSTAASGQNQLQSRMIEISLGPLDFMEIKQLISKVLRHGEDAVPDALCTDIFQRTGGLPVYVVQTLENIKRKRSLELDEHGKLQWTAEGLKEKRAISSSKTGVVMEETFLSRFDTLDVRVRKVLQTCAVLGLSFSLSDVIQVHPEIEELDIENAMEAAIDEMILVEHVEEEEDAMSLKSGSTGTGDASDVKSYGNSADPSRGSDVGVKALTDRFFQFSHAMWRQNVLSTMLKERKIELHRLIAEAMEKDQVLILEQSDISRLLTLFDHWKCCGDFCKTAPLALAVGARLEEWDLCAQSLELYEDALEMSFDTVQRVEDDDAQSEWVQVAAKPDVLDYILRLHIRIGLCHQNLGEEAESICMFEDAYNIIKTASKIPGMSKSLMMPIISSLCVLKLDQVAMDTQTKKEQEKLAEKFVKEAIANGNPVHIGRALSMEAAHYARLGNFKRAFESLDLLGSMYDLQINSFDMLAEYGRDFALECYCESVQWFYLQEKNDEAEKQADRIMDNYLSLLEDVDADIAMYCLLPIILVLKLIGRATDADYLFKKYVIIPYKESDGLALTWGDLFNPLAYLLELIVKEENDQCDDTILADIEGWVLDKDNNNYSLELERTAHTLMGEICWRLVNLKDEDDPTRDKLIVKARDLLTPVAHYPHSEVFIKHTAQALLEAL